MSQRLNLLRIRLPNTTKELLIHNGKHQYTIGRGADTDLQINLKKGTQTVSNKHLLFEVNKDNSVFVSHTSSVRHTYINGVHIPRRGSNSKLSYPVYPGDTIHLTDNTRDKPVVALRILMGSDTYGPGLIGRFTHGGTYSEFEIDELGFAKKYGQPLEELHSQEEYMNGVLPDYKSQEKFQVEQILRLVKGAADLTGSKERLVARHLYRSTLIFRKPDLRANAQLKLRFTAQDIKHITDGVQPEEPMSRSQWESYIGSKIETILDGILAEPNYLQSDIDNAEKQFWAEKSYEKYIEDLKSDDAKMKNSVSQLITALRIKLDRSQQYKKPGTKGPEDFLIKSVASEYYMERIHDFREFNEVNNIW